MPNPGEDYQRWSNVADNNGNIDPLIDWHEGQARRSVNNSARSELAAHAKNRNLNNGSIITTGSKNAQAFLSGVNYLTIPPGLRATLKVGSGLDNDGPLTLNCDGIGAVAVKLPALTECIGGEFVGDRFVDLIYNGTFWIYIYSAGNFAPINSPFFTGDARAPTPAPLDNDNSIATTEFVMNAIFGGQGIVLAQKVYSTPGAQTWTPTAGMKSCMVECIGGGGGGGGSYGDTGYIYFGAGGGSGGYSRSLFTAIQAGISQEITIGTGGIGGQTGPASGTNGGDTTFGLSGLCIAKGGLGGGQFNGIYPPPVGGAGGAAGTGDITAAGAPGGPGGWFLTGPPASAGIEQGNFGGSSIFGGGGTGAFNASGIAVGNPGRNYGSGGGGSSCIGAVGPGAGGNGSGGLIVVTEFAGAGAIGPAGPVGPPGPTGSQGPAGAGTGDVLRSGTPTTGQYALWTDGSHIQGASKALTEITGTPTVGQYARWIDATHIEGVAAPTAGVADKPTAGRLTFVSATALKFAPFKGNKIQINGALYTIPNAGIAGLTTTSAFLNGIGSSSLAGNILYYVYAFNNSGTVTADFRTDGNGHITDTTGGNEGVEVRCSTGTTPDPTRTLIGIIRTNAASQFANSNTQRLLRSWFNQVSVPFSNSLSGQTTTVSTTGVEISAAIRCEMVVWATDVITASLLGSMQNSGVQKSYASIGWDGAITSAAYNSVCGGVAGIATPLGVVESKSLSEGYHYVTHMGSTDASGQASYGTLSSFNSLNGQISAS